MKLSSTLFKKKKKREKNHKKRDAGCLPTFAFFSSFLYVFLKIHVWNTANAGTTAT